MQEAVRCNDTLQSMSWRQEEEVSGTLTQDVRKMFNRQAQVYLKKHSLKLACLTTVLAAASAQTPFQG